MNINEINALYTKKIKETIKETESKEVKKALKALLKEFEAEEFKAEVVTQVAKVVKAEKPKKLKDPEEPKKTKSAYLFFCEDKRPQVKKENPEAKAVEVLKILGAMWKALSDKKKEKYQAMSAQDKERYAKAKEDYKRPSDEELAELEINQKKKRGRKSSSEPKDPNAPKGARTAYMFYGIKNREALKEEMGDVKGTEVTKELGVRWKALDEKKKAKYVKMAEEDKLRYKEEMKAYKAEDKAEDKGDNKGDNKAEEESDVEVEDKPKAKKASTPEAGFLYYVEAKKEEIKAEMPDAPYNTIIREIGNRWNQLSAKHKSKYASKASKTQESN
jgi:hypothetical protein